MGKTYYVPRSVKGESRILYIFTVKSFIATVIFGIIGLLISMMIAKIISLSLVSRILFIGGFGGIGYVLTAIQIPDSPMLGVLRKASGEPIGNILFRLLLFRTKKKIYLYNWNREERIKIDTKKEENNKLGGFSKWKF